MNLFKDMEEGSTTTVIPSLRCPYPELGLY